MTFKIKDLNTWSLRLSVRTAGFHPAKGGSIPPGTAIKNMFYYTYMLKSVSLGTKKTYVGYSNNIKKRLEKHNSNKGAKSTKGYKWLLIYSKKFKSKKEAMSFEYKLKKNRTKRKEILEKSLL